MELIIPKEIWEVIFVLRRLLLLHEHLNYILKELIIKFKINTIEKLSKIDRIFWFGNKIAMIKFQYRYIYFIYNEKNYEYENNLELLIRNYDGPFSHIDNLYYKNVS